MYGLSDGFGSEFDLAQAIKLTKNLPYSRLTQIFEVYLLFEIDRNRRINYCNGHPSMTLRNIELTGSDLGWPRK